MVRIVEKVGDKAVRVPTNSSGLLPLSAVTAVFCDVTALKHEVHHVDGVAWDVLKLEDGLFSPPPDSPEGWGEKNFVIVRAKSRSKTYPTIKVE